ncbi:MAG: RNA methyltransferase [Paracoccaceae bacterium]
MPDPLFVLIRPQMAQNIGAAARAMLNFGLTDMALVAPRDGWPNGDAVAMASGAASVLDGARLVEGTANAIADATFVYATTARPRGLTTPVMTPEAAMRDAARREASGQRTAILFGPERAGMENDDIARANAIVTVPVNPDFPSLNLAQCVLLMAYEWRRATAQAPQADAPAQASQREVEALAEHWDGALDAAGFFFPPEKAPHMRLTLRNLWSRMPLTRPDVQLLHGALRQLVRRRG